jgi:hypothetical protein
MGKSHDYAWRRFRWYTRPQRSASPDSLAAIALDSDIVPDLLDVSVYGGAGLERTR